LYYIDCVKGGYDSSLKIRKKIESVIPRLISPPYISSNMSVAICEKIATLTATADRKKVENVEMREQIATLTAKADSNQVEIVAIHQEIAMLTAQASRVEAEEKAHDADQAARAAEESVRVAQEASRALRAAADAARAACSAPAQEKPTWAFKLGDVESLNERTLIIQDFDRFVGLHYQLASSLSDGTPLKGRIREDGKPIRSDIAKKIGEWKEKCEELKGQLIVVAACGTHGEKHGGEVRRIVGDYSYDTSLLSSSQGHFYHRFATEHVRKLTPVEFEKVMSPEQLGPKRNRNARSRVCWPIDI